MASSTASRKSVFFRAALGLAAIVAAVAGAWAYYSAAPPGTRIVLVTAGAGPYWQQVATGAREAAETHGVDLRIEFLAEEADPDSQAKLLAGLDLAHYDGMAISPASSAAAAAAVEEAAGRVRLVSFGHSAPVRNGMFHVGMGNYRAGGLCGGAIAQSMPAGAEIIVLHSCTTARCVAERLAGLEAALRRESAGGAARRYAIVELLTEDGDAEASLVAIRSALGRHPAASHVVRLSEGSARPLADALAEDANLARLKLIAFDQSTETLDAVANDRVAASLVHDPYTAGYLAVAWSAQLARSDAMGLPAAGRGSVNVPSEVVQRDTLGEFVGRTHARKSHPAG
jgi:ribose transport system substrate-binding protein